MITVIVILLVLLAIFAGVGFFIWRNVLRYAKGIERGLKMVPILIHLPPPSEDIEVGQRDVREVLQEQISQAEVLYNLIAATTTKGFKSKFYGQRHFGFEIVAIKGLIKFYAAVPVVLESQVRQAILTAYPTANLEEVEDHNIFNTTGKISGTIGGEVSLKQSYSYPIATFTQLKRSAVQAFINAMSSLETGDGAGVQILLRPAMSGWTKTSEGLVSKKRKGKQSNKFDAKAILQAPFKPPDPKEEGKKDPPEPLSNLEQATVDAIEEKTKHPGYEVLIRVIASSNTATRSQAILHNLVAGFALFDAPGLNGFKFSPAKDIESFVTAYIFRFFPPEARGTILNSVELATLFHLPDDQFTHSSQVDRQYSKQVEGPSKLPTQGLLLGQNHYRGVKKDIRLSAEDRRRHTYIIGQTGTGKSTILKQMVVQDMLAGNGFAFIDPHGDAAEDIMTMVPKHRSEDVIYFNPGDMDYPLGLNIFEHTNSDEKDFIIQECINMLYRLYDPGHTGIIGPIYEHWFRNAALAVMADPNGGTFIDIPKLFIDKQYQRDKLKHVTDPTVIDFWTREMVQGAGGRQGEVMQWFVSKFGAFASNTMMRNIIGQTKSAFDLREIMDSGKILIANLSKGKLGELNSMLLGVFFVMKFQAAAMSRADIPENQRRDFCLFVDEFQNFSTDSFATVLSEARKYRLNLIVANQFIEQLSEEIRDAVFGNVGTILSFRCGPNDADFLVKQFAPAFEARDLVNLPNLNAAVRLMSAGLPSQPFSMQLLPPLSVVNPQLGVALKQLSAAKYGRPRAEVEAEIFKRLESKPAPDPFAALGGGPTPFGAGGPRPLGSPSAATGRPMSTGSAGSAGGSSFLDEWLAKRRGSAASNTSISPRPNAAPVSMSTQPAPAGVPNSPQATQQPHQEKVIQPPGEASPRPAESESPKAGQVIRPTTTTTRLNSAGSIKPPILHTATGPTIDLHKTSKSQFIDSKAMSEPPKPTTGPIDSQELDSKISSLQAEVSKSKTAVPSKVKPATPAAPPPLKPGEIFIDDEGLIHHQKHESNKVS